MDQIGGKLLQQLGIVAGICDEASLADTIDNLIDKPGRKVSVGTAVKSMVLNALGFSNRALYLTPQFYKNRPVDVLLGVEAEDLHDDCLGTALDALYEYGITELFYKVSSRALKTFEISHRFVHLDTTTFSFHGKYEDEEDEPEVVSVTKGYSKDHNPDLNQVVLSLICSYRSSIPAWLEVLRGNSSDKKSFVKSIKAFRNQLSEKELPHFVADSALYSKQGINELSEIKWVTRVPESLTAAKKCIAETEVSHMSSSEEDGYCFREMHSEYGDIPHRWLIVFSENAYK